MAATPLRLDQYPYYEAHGLSIATFANRELRWSEGTIEAALIVACVVALVVVVALKLLPATRSPSPRSRASLQPWSSPGG